MSHLARREEDVAEAKAEEEEREWQLWCVGNDVKRPSLDFSQNYWIVEWRISSKSDLIDQVGDLLFFYSCSFSSPRSSRIYDDLYVPP